MTPNPPEGQAERERCGRCGKPRDKPGFLSRGTLDSMIVCPDSYHQKPDDQGPDPQPTGPEKGEGRRFTIYVCHACGWIQGEEQPDLSCAQCGEPRTFIETVEVVEDANARI